MTAPASWSWWPGVLRRDRPGSGRWCVRLDWSDGTHDLVTYHRTRTAAQRSVAGLNRYWCRGPHRPVSCVVVVISRHDWRLHRDRRGCRAPDCPTPDIDTPVEDRAVGYRVVERGARP